MKIQLKDEKISKLSENYQHLENMYIHLKHSSELKIQNDNSNTLYNTCITNNGINSMNTEPTVENIYKNENSNSNTTAMIISGIYILYISYIYEIYTYIYITIYIYIYISYVYISYIHNNIHIYIYIYIVLYIIYCIYIYRKKYICA